MKRWERGKRRVENGTRSERRGEEREDTEETRLERSNWTQDTNGNARKRYARTCDETMKMRQATGWGNRGKWTGE